MRKLILLLLFISFSAFAQFASERITQFNSDITINKDASIDVTEVITVYAAGDSIKHGLVRWLPTQYKDSYGIKHDSSYQIAQVKLNNESSPYHIKRQDNQFIIYIGDANVDLAPGIYTYTLQYHVNHAINFLRDADELYWNITGNDWRFTIESVQARIQLPPGAQIVNDTAYTGYLGQQGKDFSTLTTTPDQIIFKTKNPLQAKEGLTIAVAFTKGIVNKPALFTDLQARINPEQIILFAIALVLFLYYMVAWYQHGRDPRAGTIVPLFEPPQNLSPAAMRYIMKMGFDTKVFAAAIVNMAVKRFLTIVDNKVTLTLKKENASASMLSAEEKKIGVELFNNASSLVINRSNRQPLNAAQKVCQLELEASYLNKYFINNTKYFVFGLLLSALAFVTVYLYEDSSDAAIQIFLLSLAWTVGFYALIFLVRKVIKNTFTFYSLTNVKTAIFYFLFAALFLYVSFSHIHVSSMLNSFSLTLILLLIIITLNIIFYILLKAPTPEGRRIMDQIAGFKLFLGTTERYRFNTLHPPEQTPELFEKYLPYAIALEVENIWVEQFTDLLKQSTATETRYRPVWYSGPALTSATITSFPGMLTLSLSSALSSSSASGGGGSSGGGGGGGGGGGW